MLFGDPRPDGHIAFYAYRATQANAPRRNPELSGPSFKLPDNYKHDLKKQLQRLIPRLGRPSNRVVLSESERRGADARGDDPRHETGVGRPHSTRDGRDRVPSSDRSVDT